ncbi:unnamed protein product [Closterium sp. Naga37s-1]|nr:unnamed protein product [Closterium sp. Naga37s-1]
MAEVQELVGFLLSPRPEVQRMAVGIVAGLTGSDEGLSKLLPEADVIAAALLPLLSANKEISLPSAQALVNLSQHDVAAKAVIKARGVETAGGMAVGRGGAAGGGGGGGKGKNAGLMVMLLANLTQLDEGAEKLLEVRIMGVGENRGAGGGEGGEEEKGRRRRRGGGGEGEEEEKGGGGEGEEEEKGRRRRRGGGGEGEEEEKGRRRRRGGGGEGENRGPSGSVPLLASLTRRFATSADREEWQEDEYEHVATIPLSKLLCWKYPGRCNCNPRSPPSLLPLTPSPPPFPPLSPLSLPLFPLCLQPSGSVPLLASLTRQFAMSADREEGQEDEYEHVATILVNATRLEAARKLLLDPEKKLLRQILPQTSSPNRNRSQGAMATVRNCCFDASSGALPSLLLLADLLWPSLLLPLAGTREYSKEDREQMPPELAVPLSMERPPVTDGKLRADAADALFLIASEEAGRKALWSVHGARILQVGYEDEEDPTVMEAMERVGSLVSGRGCDVVV